jgi:hypothetical protein
MMMMMMAAMKMSLGYDCCTWNPCPGAAAASASVAVVVAGDQLAMLGAPARPYGM